PSSTPDVTCEKSKSLSPSFTRRGSIPVALFTNTTCERLDEPPEDPPPEDPPPDEPSAAEPSAAAAPSLLPSLACLSLSLPPCLPLDLLDRAFERAAGEGVHGHRGGLTGAHVAHVRLCDQRPHPDAVQVGHGQ